MKRIINFFLLIMTFLSLVSCVVTDDGYYNNNYGPRPYYPEYRPVPPPPPRPYPGPRPLPPPRPPGPPPRPPRF
ncbi:MAG: hypothetical protein KBF12_02670 [Sebaldella sp.]|nr:hypothetical protein [Sebaldella sp.]